jgi:hypothetical protein
VLKSLSEQYARRAREFSDTVALLGHHNSVGPEVLKLFEKIKHQRAFTIASSSAVDQFVRASSKKSV